MASVSPFLLLLWFPVMLVLFARLPGHRAVIVGTILGLLFLPEVNDHSTTEGVVTAFSVPMIVFQKLVVLSLSVVAASLCLDFRRWRAFRPAWYDLPMLAWCVCPFLSSVTNEPPPNGLSPWYDGFAQARFETIRWGLPYLVGRLYFTDLGKVRELVLGVFVGGLVYIPFCLFEVRFSPQLHRMVYGFEQHDFVQTMRVGGGYRPMVFMEHGLEVGLWLAAAALAGFWLWYTEALRRLTTGLGLPPVPTLWLVAALSITLVLAKSAGALVLGLVGLAVLYSVRWVPWPVALIGLIAVGPLYFTGRIMTSGQPVGWVKADFDNDKEVEDLTAAVLQKPMFGWAPWRGQDCVNALTSLFNEERASSFQFRMINEDMLMERAAERPLFGWAGHQRASILDRRGKDMTTVDGLWIIALGNRGLVGLVALYLAMYTPVLVFVARYPVQRWTQPDVAPAAAAAMIVVVWMTDNLTNAMFNPVYVLLAGGLASLPRRAAVAPSPPAAEARRPELPAVRRPTPRPPEVQRPGVLTRRKPFSR